MFNPKVFLLDQQDSRDSTLIAGFTDLSPDLISPKIIINHDEHHLALRKKSCKKDVKE